LSVELLLAISYLDSMSLKKAYFGGGCFWCTESFFQNLTGVTTVVSGYAGGNIKNPSYKEICTGLTGHAELIEIGYDNTQISYEDLLRVFFSTHDPTTLNRQGADVGTQYRSVIFYQSEEEKVAAETFIATEASGAWDNPIITELSPLPVFYHAEPYHQNYYRNNPNQGYCRVVINPKLVLLKKKFSHLMNPDEQ